MFVWNHCGLASLCATFVREGLRAKPLRRKGEADIAELETEIVQMLREVVG